jgi:hypothetical protein
MRQLNTFIIQASTGVLMLALAACGRLGYEALAGGASCVGVECLSDAGVQQTTDAFDGFDSLEAPIDAPAPAVDAASSSDDDAVQAADTMPIFTVALPYSQGFESGLLNWGVFSAASGATRSRDTTRKRTGAASLKVESKTNGGGGFIEVSLPKPLTTGQINMRSFMFVPNTTVISAWIVPTEIKGALPDDAKFSLDLAPAQAYNADLAPPGARNVPNAKFPQDRWVCTELEMTLSANAGSARLFVDDTLVYEYKKVGTLINAIVPGVQRFRLGLIAEASQKPTALWFDDWAIDTAHIGCK